MEGKAGDFKNLKVWQRAHNLTLFLYGVTESFPATEQFGLTVQLRRASASIAANIAESRGRLGLRDQQRFLHIAQGSAREVESHLLLARDLGLLATDQSTHALMLVREVQRMLAALIGRRADVSPPAR